MRAGCGAGRIGDLRLTPRKLGTKRIPQLVELGRPSGRMFPSPGCRRGFSREVRAAGALLVASQQLPGTTPGARCSVSIFGDAWEEHRGGLGRDSGSFGLSGQAPASPSLLGQGCSRVSRLSDVSTARPVVGWAAAVSSCWPRGRLERATLGRATLGRATSEWATSEWATSEWATLGRATQGWATSEWATLGRATLEWAILGRATQGWAILGRATLEWATQGWATQGWATLGWATSEWATLGAPAQEPPAQEEPAPRPFPGPGDVPWKEEEGDRRWAPHDCPPPPPWDGREAVPRPEDGFGEIWYQDVLPDPWPEFPEEEQPPPGPPGNPGTFGDHRPPWRHRPAGRRPSHLQQPVLVPRAWCPRPPRGHKARSKPSSPAHFKRSQPAARKELQPPEPPQPPAPLPDAGERPEQPQDVPAAAGNVLEPPSPARSPQESPGSPVGDSLVPGVLPALELPGSGASLAAVTSPSSLIQPFPSPPRCLFARHGTFPGCSLHGFLTLTVPSRDRHVSSRHCLSPGGAGSWADPCGQPGSGSLRCRSRSSPSRGDLRLC
ncbi:hypothetical protein DV515_00016393 [Chloebia gouldiae]|uniref:Basic proline-rich protein-like n=1 Tax=Chloebia gouldiae TaxID=44316 RepID=A0A3L8RSS6_CHLGU|nr:hypothetical protein DV515_00016393 [Chloebia gouldiae]